MTEDIYLETYLFVSLTEYRICLYDTKNNKNLYNECLKREKNLSNIDLSVLIKFLDNNIFKIEKLVGKFIKNIFLILETEKIYKLSFGIKKKNYDNYINKKFLEKIIVDAKDFYRENNNNYKILHILINKYIVDGNQYSVFEDGIKGDNFSLEIEFLSISNNFVFEVDKILKRYQIKIIRYLDGNYIKNFYQNDNTELSTMVHKIHNGINNNEVKLVNKNLKKLGFFEKFFQFFN